MLIVTTHQFGYHTDYYYWCFFLKDEYDITYLTFIDSEKPEIVLEGVTIVNVPAMQNFLKRQFDYIKTLREILKNNVFDNIIVTEQIFSSILRLFLPEKGLIFDIRSVAVLNNVAKRFVYDLSYMLCTKIYPYCTGITNYIAEYYNINKHKFSELPLGSNILSNTSKIFDKLDLLYIGCLRNGFEETIIGFSKYHETHPDSTYTIIGFNAYVQIDMENVIKTLIIEYNLQNCVFYLGRLTHSEALRYFDHCNVGISYIPLTSYFDYQPPTKNYEYMLSGMVCLATSTKANKEMINFSNGVLIRDNADSFAFGLNQLWDNRLNYNSNEIRSSQQNFTWESIVKNTLKGILQNRELK